MGPTERNEFKMKISTQEMRKMVDDFCWSDLQLNETNNKKSIDEEKIDSEHFVVAESESAKKEEESIIIQENVEIEEPKNDYQDDVDETVFVDAEEKPFPTTTTTTTVATGEVVMDATASIRREPNLYPPKSLLVPREDLLSPQKNQ